MNEKVVRGEIVSVILVNISEQMFSIICFVKMVCPAEAHVTH